MKSSNDNEGDNYRPSPASGSFQERWRLDDDQMKCWASASEKLAKPIMEIAYEEARLMLDEIPSSGAMTVALAAAMAHGFCCYVRSMDQAEAKLVMDHVWSDFAKLRS